MNKMPIGFAQRNFKQGSLIGLGIADIIIWYSMRKLKRENRNNAGNLCTKHAVMLGDIVQRILSR